MKDFRRLEVWHLAVQLVASIYEQTGPFPQSEQYGLTSQLRRAAVSISSNIAEGAGRMTQGDFARFLSYARGSSSEVVSQLFVAAQLGFVAEQNVNQLLTDVRQLQRMLGSLIRKIKSESAATDPHRAT